MCRPPRIPANLEERTARRSLPATFVGCVCFETKAIAVRVLLFPIRLGNQPQAKLHKR